MKHPALQTRAAVHALDDAGGTLVISDSTERDIWNGCHILQRDGLVRITEARYSGRQDGSMYIVEKVNRALLMHIHLSQEELKEPAE